MLLVSDRVGTKYFKKPSGGNDKVGSLEGKRQDHVVSGCVV